MSVEPGRWIARLRSETTVRTPRHHEMLQVWATFLEAKYDNDLERMGVLLAADAFVRAWGVDRRVPPTEDIYGAAEIVSAWGALTANGQPPAEELKVDRLLVSDDGIAMDGVFSGRYPLKALPALELGDTTEVVVTVRATILVRFSGALLAGYDVYWDNNYTVSAHA